MDSNIGMYSILLSAGLLGSIGHCMGMCGPLVAMVGLRIERRGLAKIPYFLLYHGARIAVYCILGAAAGGLGSLFGFGPGLNRIASLISIALGTGVILLGMGYLGWLPLGRVQGGGAWLNRAMNQAIAYKGYKNMVLLGALNGLLPCGLVYSSLLILASSGGALPGALGMLIFGAGTVPALLVIGLGAGALSAKTRQLLAHGAGFLIMITGLQLCLRGAAALGVLPSLKLGGFVLW